MKRLNFNISILDQYLSTFARMSKEARKYLIDKLQNIENEPKMEYSEIDLYGAWSSEESAEQLIESIYNSRSSSRKIESL